MTAKQKLWTLAKSDAGMRAIFGTNPFRWCDVRLVPGYIPRARGSNAPGGGTSTVIVRRISTLSTYVMLGQNPLEKIRFQLDVLDLDENICEASAIALINWLGTVDLVSGAQFGSPVTTPPQFPNFNNNRRSGLYPQPGQVVYAESIDEWVYNDTSN